MARTTTKMGLTSWDDADDDYDYQQLANNWQLVDFHDHTPGRGVPIGAGGLGAGAVLQQNIAAGVVGSQHLSTALSQDLGIGVNGRGSVGVSSASTVTTTGITVLDSVANLDVSANALIGITYQALWKTSGGIAYSAIAVNGVSTVVAANNGAPTGGASIATTSSSYLSPLVTNGFGLATGDSTTANSSEATNGQIVGISSGGGETYLYFNTAGTYTIGVGFYMSSASYTATIQNRHLWVRTINFE